MRTPGLFVHGTGTALPERVQVAQAVARGDYGAEEAAATGFTSIAVAGPESAPDLALRAAATAVERSGAAPESLGHLFYADVYHAGPEGWCPQSYLQRRLALGGLLAVGVRQGCNGMFGALSLADAVLRSAPADQGALLVAADNFGSPLLDRWHCNPGLVMGDGAGALVLSRTEGFAEVLTVASVTIAGLEGMHRGDTPLYPPDVTVGRPLAFGDRFDEFTRSGGWGPEGGLVFVRHLVELVDRLLGEAQITTGDLTRVAFNHAGRQLVQDRLAPLGIPVERTTWEFGSTVGHLGAADQAVAFDHLLDTGELGPGSYLMMLGIGPGVGIAGAVLRVLERPSWNR